MDKTSILKTCQEISFDWMQLESGRRFSDHILEALASQFVGVTHKYAHDCSTLH